MLWRVLAAGGPTRVVTTPRSPISGDKFYSQAQQQLLEAPRPCGRPTPPRSPPTHRRYGTGCGAIRSMSVRFRATQTPAANSPRLTSRFLKDKPATSAPAACSRSRSPPAAPTCGSRSDRWRSGKRSAATRAAPPARPSALRPPPPAPPPCRFLLLLGRRAMPSLPARRGLAQGSRATRPRAEAAVRGCGCGAEGDGRNVCGTREWLEMRGE